MTLAGWVMFGAFASFIMGCGFLIAAGVADYKSESRLWLKRILAVLVSAALCMLLLVGMRAWFHKTESGRRSLKTWKSETSRGLNRRVCVYDVSGKLIKEYRGRFDMTYDRSRIIFDDQSGKRHVIYYSTGTVIVDEL